MPAFDHVPDEEPPAADGYLQYYRAAVERLRGETEDELGAQPMPPEKLSMFAVAIASLPLVALMHPAIPLQPVGWGVGLALSVVWLIAYRFQARRYERSTRSGAARSPPTTRPKPPPCRRACGSSAAERHLAKA